MLVMDFPSQTARMVITDQRTDSRSAPELVKMYLKYYFLTKAYCCTRNKLFNSVRRETVGTRLRTIVQKILRQFRVENN